MLLFWLLLLSHISSTKSMTIWIETDLPDAEDFPFVPNESPSPEAFIPHESPQPFISSNTDDTDETIETLDVFYDEADDYVYDYLNISNTKTQFHPNKFLAYLYEYLS